MCSSLSCLGNPKQLQGWFLMLVGERLLQVRQLSLIFGGRKKERENMRFSCSEQETLALTGKLLGFTWEQERICMP